MGLATAVKAAIIVGAIGSISSTFLGELTKPAVVNQEYVCIYDGVAKRIDYFSNGESKPNGSYIDDRCNGWKDEDPERHFKNLY